ncbi:MAG: hypothetical protein COA44_03330 [Arcobacter sp.]|nr:MAG: hypothetical protein COA44_03330 [Arcobacter sp.]
MSLFQNSCLHLALEELNPNHIDTAFKKYKSSFLPKIDNIKNKIVVLSLKEQEEWTDYFNDYQKDLQELKSQINKTDKERIEFLFELYEEYLGE